MNDSSLLPFVSNRRVGEPSHGGGLGTWVNDSSMLPLVCNSMVGEHLTGSGCGDLGE